jgi:hypothetical protein
LASDYTKVISGGTLDVEPIPRRVRRLKVDLLALIGHSRQESLEADTDEQQHWREVQSMDTEFRELTSEKESSQEEP